MITNKTVYDTEYLKKLVEAVFCFDANIIFKGDVTFATARGHHAKASCFTKSFKHYIKVLLPKPGKCKNFEVDNKGKTLWCPLLTMPNAQRVYQLIRCCAESLYFNRKIDRKWWLAKVNWPVEFIPVEKKPFDTSILLNKRYEIAKMMKCRWEKRFKTAKRLVKKWEKKVKYYEGKLK